MTANDERDLHESLDRALETIVPRSAPVDDAMRRGTAIRKRRHWAGAVAAGAACVVVVAGLAVLVSAQSRGSTQSSSASVKAPSYGVIASGRIDGKSWRIDARAPGSHGVSAEQEIVGVSGPAFGDAGMYETVGALRAPRDVPVSLSGISSTEAQAQYGAVRADVSYITVRLGDGEVLTVHPVDLFGVRVVGFVVPAGHVITEVVAYSRDGEVGAVGAAVPFNDPGGMAYFGRWLGPGQRGGGHGSVLVGSGSFSAPAPLGRQTWSATAYTGPWGTCVKGGSGQITRVGCVTDSGGTRILFGTIGAWPVYCGVAGASVTRVVVHRADGSTAVARPVMVQGRKFFAFLGGRGEVRWTAYDGSGSVVATGSSGGSSGG